MTGVSRRSRVVLWLLRRVLRWERSALGHVEVRWASTWCLRDLTGEPQTRLLERVLGLPQFADAFVMEHDDYRQLTIGASKLRAVREAWAAGDSVIWTDDEWTPDPSHPLHEELTRDGRGLLIRPRERDGLTREHLEQIEAFVALPKHA